jgi:hypothetical protein
VLDAADPDEVLAAAETILRREFPRLEVRRDERRIVAHPVEYLSARNTGTARDLIGARSRMRRLGNLQVGKKGGGAIAHLRIEIQRQDTERRRAVQPGHYRISDSPAYTPIDRDAATTVSQNTVWTFVRRDRRLERALLTELQERFAPPPSGQPKNGAKEPTETP